MSVHPQSACHMVEAWAGAGSENNPRARAAGRRPHLVTIDRDNPPRPDPPGPKFPADARRKMSTRDYICPSVDANGKKLDNKDEYPQALFFENYGTASVKCVLEGDNKGSGSSIASQLRRGSYGFLENSSIVEMVVTP
jgi:hypothetical protein